MTHDAAGQDGLVPETPERPDEVSVRLPPDLKAPAAARAAAREALRHWRLGKVVEDVLLAVSELVTNAVRHGRPPVWMVLRREPGRLVPDVHDDEPSTGTSSAASESAESGRGLHIVDSVAEQVEVQQVPDDGKVVHVVFAAEDGPEGR